jgi:hypothetical protein
VYTEIMSFLKGSAEAVSSPDGLLSLDEYLDMGNKKAPNFTKERRQQVREQGGRSGPRGRLGVRSVGGQWALVGLGGKRSGR